MGDRRREGKEKRGQRQIGRDRVHSRRSPRMKRQASKRKGKEGKYLIDAMVVVVPWRAILNTCKPLLVMATSEMGNECKYIKENSKRG
jgi:hypothetical protein